MLITLLWMLLAAGGVASLQLDTVYMYSNRTVFVQLEDLTLLEIPLNGPYASNQTISSQSQSIQQVESPPSDLCKLVSVQYNLYAFCNSTENTLSVLQYTPAISNSSGASQHWHKVPVPEVDYFIESTYLHSMVDPMAVYIFSGVDPETNSLSSRMLRLDLVTNLFTNSSLSITQPEPFAEATTLEINSNTQMILGGSNSLMGKNSNEIPVWQYNSWAEREMKPLDGTPPTLQGPLVVLPVFDESNQFAFNGTMNDFHVSSVMILHNENAGKLNVSSFVWEWQETTNEAATNLELSTAAAIVTLYDTVMVISNNDVNSGKRELNYKMKLFSAKDFSKVDSINYSQLQSQNILKNHTVNKSLIIALSVIIPILVIIIALCGGLFYYRRYKQKKLELENEKEIKAIVDFYQSKHYSQSTFSTNGGTTLNDSLPSSASDVEVNNYDQDDNISINRQPSPKKSISSTILRTLSLSSKTLPPTPRLSNNNATLNHIPENSSLSTFQTSSTKVKSNKSSRTRSISSYYSTDSELGGKTYPYSLSNKSDGSLVEQTTSSVLGVMRRVSSKRISSKLKITNPDIIEEEDEAEQQHIDVSDKVSIVDMNLNIGVEAENPFSHLPSDLFRGGTIYDKKQDPFKNTQTDLFTSTTKNESNSDEQNDLMDNDNPFSETQCDLFRGQSLYQPNNPFNDMRADIFRGNSVYFKKDRKATKSENPFSHLDNTLFRGQSLYNKHSHPEDIV